MRSEVLPWCSSCLPPGLLSTTDWQERHERRTGARHERCSPPQLSVTTSTTSTPVTHSETCWGYQAGRQCFNVRFFARRHQSSHISTNCLIKNLSDVQNFEIREIFFRYIIPCENLPVRQTWEKIMKRTISIRLMRQLEEFLIWIMERRLTSAVMRKWFSVVNIYIVYFLVFCNVGCVSVCHTVVRPPSLPPHITRWREKR